MMVINEGKTRKNTYLVLTGDQSPMASVLKDVHQEREREIERGKNMKRREHEMSNYSQGKGEVASN